MHIYVHVSWCISYIRINFVVYDVMYHISLSKSLGAAWGHRNTFVFERGATVLTCEWAPVSHQFPEFILKSTAAMWPLRSHSKEETWHHRFQQQAHGIIWLQNGPANVYNFWCSCWFHPLITSKDSPISWDPQHHVRSFGRIHVAQVQDLAWMASGLDILYEAWGGL